MDEEGLATAWGSAVAEALDYAPDSYADDSARALDALASSAQGEPGRNFSGTSTEDWEDAAGVVTEAYGGSSGSFTNRQWATLAATHIPLLVLWTFAIVAALERVSVAARWLARSFRASRSSDDSSVDDDDDDADDDRARLVGPPGSEYQQHPGHAPPPVRRALPLQLPYVCVQLPMYDEAKVARRIIDSACLLRWPRDLLEIQILDDSDDERCRAIVDASAARWRERGLMCNVVRRSHRRGFKAGALEAGRKKTAADLVAVFDADCVPFPDYLERVVPHFYEPDGVTMVPDLAMVQARWGFLNHDDNVVTRAQAMGLEAHRAAASAALSRSAGCCVRAGAGATWSARAVTAAGGWDATALLEGTDLALRAHCAGYVSRFLDRVVVMTELPGTFAAYKAQQERWARGWAQVTKRHAFPVAAGSHGKPLATRLHLLAVVTRHAAWPVALVWALAFPVLVARGGGWSLYDGGMDRTAATVAYVAPFATLVAADVAATTTLSPAPPLRAMRRSRALAIRATWIVPHLVVQTGMVVHRALSFALGVVSPRVDFARTPKDGRGAAYVGAYGGDESARVGEGRTDAGAAAAETGGTGGSRGGPRRGGVAGATRGAARPAEEEEMQSPTKRAGRGGHFDAAAPGGRMPTIPGTPPRPELGGGGGDGGEVAVSMPDASGRASSSSPVGSSSSSGASSSRASSSSPPESPELVAMRRTTFVTELVVSAAMLRLAFAVAVVDGWREPALMCVGFAACVAFVAAHHGDDGWRASRRRSNMAGVESLRFADRRGGGFAGAGGAEALLAPSARETYGGLDGASNAALGGRDGESLRFADGVRSGFGGGVYDHRARTRRPAAPDPAGDRRDGGPDVRGGWGGEHESGGFSRSAHETRSAIRQYKRYRAKDFDLDTISVRSGESDAYSARRSAAGGRGGGGRGGGGGANDGSEDWGADSYSEAGLSETVYSELSAAVFADAPPVLLSAAQLQQQYVGAGGSGSARGPESVARESTSEFAPEDADAGEAHGAREER